MLKTRPITPDDIDEVRELHNQYYPEFTFPDFYRLLCGFVVEDEKDDIVLAGGVEMCGEMLTVSNHDKSNIKLGRALLIAQGACGVTCEKFKIRNLYAFVNRPNFAEHMKRHGFSERIDIPLRLGIPNGW